MINKLFKLDKGTASHVTVIVFGIKFHSLKPQLRRQRKSLREKYSSANISQIPKAEGQLRLIQMANLGLLKIFDEICKENGLKYWLDFGTLLGAVRHKGFIPWDDDIDVGMMREDYEKIIELFKNGIKDHPELYCFFSCNGRNKCFVKIRHKESLNIFIDIFPYEYYHSKLSQQEKSVLSKKITRLMKKNIFKPRTDEESLRKHLKDITYNKILNQKTPDKNIQPALFWGLDFPHKWNSKVYNYENIFPLKEILFEGNYFPCPGMKDTVLTNVYRSYMEIPKNTYPRHSSYLEMEPHEKSVLENYACTKV